MDEPVILIILLFVIAVIGFAIVLPIVALIISIRSRRNVNEKIARLQSAEPFVVPPAIYSGQGADDARFSATIQQLSLRVERLEAAISGSSPFPTPDLVDDVKRVSKDSPEPAQPSTPATEETPLPPTPESKLPPRGTAQRFSAQTIHADQIESIIGRRLLGWAAVGLILFAAAFFLKYAFDNRWIGELGRVAIGVAAGITLTVIGFRFHLRRWRVFSQILTGGGVVLLYLSVYAAFAYYHLATQQAAFVFLAILVAETACLALLYDAPAIAVVGLIGGFLNPLLLHSDRDQYVSLFAYITLLDVGALALLKRWWGLSSLAFVGTHGLFWLWYDGSYHPRKLFAVLVFQTGVFVIFLLSRLGRQLLRLEPATLEDLALVVINPFVFFATAYHLLYADYHDWMGVFAILMAIIFAGATKISLQRSTVGRGELLCLIGVAFTFVTLAIPIQLHANWITIGWSVEALLLLWTGLEIRTSQLRMFGYALFGLALIRLVFWDTPGESRPLFTPVLNKYFLSSMVVSGCLFGAAFIYKRRDRRREVFAPRLTLAISLVAIVTLLLVLSVETHTFFAARAATRKVIEDFTHERWLGQMALSVLWSIYAGVLAAVGFVRRSAGIRWAGLVLFGITVIKVMMVDIAQLEQLYRIIVFLVLGVLLLVVTWGYHKAFYSQESSK
jgi:uncharacterized membrane protein